MKRVRIPPSPPSTSFPNEPTILFIPDLAKPKSGMHEAGSNPTVSAIPRTLPQTAIHVGRSRRSGSGPSDFESSGAQLNRLTRRCAAPDAALEVWKTLSLTIGCPETRSNPCVARIFLAGARPYHSCSLIETIDNQSEWAKPSRFVSESRPDRHIQIGLQ